MGNRESHDFLLIGDKGVDFSRGLRNGGNESSYSPEGVPWQQRTPFQEARSLLQQNNPSIGQGTADRMELLCSE